MSEIRQLHRPFTWWRHSTSTNRILQFLTFLCKLGLFLNLNMKGKWKRILVVVVNWRHSANGLCLIRTAAILSRETEKALFYHPRPRSEKLGSLARRVKRKLLKSLGTKWPPCDKGPLHDRNFITVIWVFKFVVLQVMVIDFYKPVELLINWNSIMMQ